MKISQRSLIIAMLFVCGIMYFIANFQRIAIPGAVYDILENELNITAPYITAFGAVFMYVYAVGQLITGVLVDRYGGLRVIACGGIIFGIGCLLFPLSSYLSLMYLSRALIGFGCSMFYLCLINELKKLFSDKNYGIALSIMLFFGYLGGIIANAPFVALMKFMSWRDILFAVAFVVFVSLIVFLIMLSKVKLPDVKRDVTLRITPFLTVLKQKHNRNLYSFACCNFGISYVIQTIIGKKFLEDFCSFPINKAALILSIMAVIAAAFNIINATVCKLCHNHRVIFLKSASVITFLCLFTIILFILFDVKSIAIGIVFCIIAGNASISSLIIPVIQQSNQDKYAVTAVSIMNFSFFVMVGVLGTVTGFLLNIHTPQRINGILAYDKSSYLLLFGFFLALSVFEMYKAAKLSNRY